MSCDDGDPCTSDGLVGAACNPSCGHTALDPDPAGADGCCPPGLTRSEDADCKPPCGPDVAQDCVDLCQGKQCLDGEYCRWGQCVPWGDGDEVGCDCHMGQVAPPVMAAPVSLALVLLLWVRRRR